MSNDAVKNPAHYTGHPSGIECIQITEHMGFNLGNSMKYIWRCDLKTNAIEDLKKAIWYIEREVKKREAFLMSDEKFKTGATRDPGVERAAVAIFAQRMIEKLQQNSDKAHWGEADIWYLQNRLKEELDELQMTIIDDRPPNDIISECCDVALFAMFIADNLRTGAK